MKRWPLVIFILLGFPAWAQGMRPNQEPVPSPSDLRAERAQDRPDGQAPEDRTPSPSDLSTERPRTDGDRPTSGIQDPRNASAGGTGSQPSPDNVTGAQEPAREPLKKY